MIGTGTMVTCTECGGVMVVEGDNLALPYVCPPCVEEFNRTTAPARSSQTAQAEAEYVTLAPQPHDFLDLGDPGDEHEHVHNGGDDSEETTNALISDLEDQNAALREALQQADTLIEDLNAVAEKEKKITDTVIGVNERLVERVDALEDELIHAGKVAKDASRVIDTLEAENDTLHDSLRRAGSLMHRMLQKSREKDASLAFYRGIVRRQFGEIRFYLSRGFWARLFNARYKASGQF